MPDNTDYRLYIERCFKTIDEKLNTIVGQTTKTNGKVQELEDESNKRQVVIDDFRHLEKEFKFVKEKVDKIDNDLLEVWFFKKYPRAFVGVLVAAVISALILVRTKLGTVNDSVQTLQEQVDIISAPVPTRSGIKYIPSRKLYDSLYREK